MAAHQGNEHRQGRYRCDSARLAAQLSHGRAFDAALREAAANLFSPHHLTDSRLPGVANHNSAAGERGCTGNERPGTHVFLVVVLRSSSQFPVLPWSRTCPVHLEGDVGWAGVSYSMLRIAACVKPKPAQGEIQVFDCFFEPLVSAFHLLVLDQSSLASEAAACRDGKTLAPFAAKFNFQGLRHPQHESWAVCD